MELPIDSPKLAFFSTFAYLAIFDERMVISDCAFKNLSSIAILPEISCRRHYAMGGKAELHESFVSSLGGKLELFAVPCSHDE